MSELVSSKSGTGKQKKCVISKDMILVKGPSSTIFSGFLNEKKIALKRISCNDFLSDSDEEMIQKDMKHHNVIKLLHFEKTTQFRLLAFEWANASLEDYFDGFYDGVLPSKKTALLQMGQGLQYIHSKGIIHCDLKPSNILISNPFNLTKWTNPEIEPEVNLKIADFGISKYISSEPFALPLVNEEEKRWMAPETWCDEEVLQYYNVEREKSRPTQEKNYGFPIDIWAIGCVFYSLMSKGHHPFGNYFKAIRGNVLMDTPIEIQRKLKKILSANHRVYELIVKMLHKYPQNRISISNIIVELEKEISDKKKPTDTINEKSKTFKFPTSTACAKVQGENNQEAPKMEFESSCGIVCKQKLGDLFKEIGNCTTRLGMLNESAIRNSLHATCNEEEREISSLYELVKVYLKAGGDCDEGAILEGCQLVAEYLYENGSEKHFHSWYFERAKNYLLISDGLRTEIGKRNPLTVNVNKKNNLWNKYKAAKLTNFIEGYLAKEVKDCMFQKRKSPIFLLALFESLKDREDLLNFPPPGVITMDIPMKMSVAIESIHIEVGEIKMSAHAKVIAHAQKQLQRSLLCFKWLDTIFHPDRKKEFKVQLIGNIYVYGNASLTANILKCQEFKKANAVSRERNQTCKDEILFKLKYVTYP